MVETMYDGKGVGIAAPQVEVMQRVVIIDPSAGEEASQLLAMINPRVTWQSPKVVTEVEGCLSLPGMVLQVTRPCSVDVVYNDVMGIEHHVKCDGHKARIVQHELDHLDGILMFNRVGDLARKIAMKDLGNYR